MLFVFYNDAPKDLLSVLEPFKNLISVDTIPLTPQTKLLYKKLGLRKNGCYLVRPDKYIAYRSDNFDPEHFAKYLSQFLKK